jgi:hypothetical protein
MNSYILNNKSSKSNIKMRYTKNYSCFSNYEPTLRQSEIVLHV